MATLPSAAKDVDVKPGQTHDQDWTFGIAEFDPSHPFLDDSALLGGLTPDWCGDFLDQSQFPLPIDRRDHSLTSHEASSDEEHGVGFSSKLQAVISSNAFISHDWSLTASNDSIRPRYEACPQLVDLSANNDSSLARHHAHNRSTSSTTNTGHYNLDHDDDCDDDGEGSVASDSSLVKFTSNSSRRSRQAGTSTQNTRSSSNHNSHHNSNVQNPFADFRRGVSNGVENSSHSRSADSVGGGRGSATGRKKATEQARTVLMDWLHENKGKKNKVIVFCWCWCWCWCWC